ncbi:MAG TPA: hypothetical protein VJ301_11710 [Propionibacteriaceae bacterium]|nr:hypothetical protein [Propionibacteriaceae bacterium]
MTTNTPPLAVKLNNGLVVLAKLYHGAPSALKYANRTQAEKAAHAVGGTVRGHRPFYVTPPPACVEDPS